MAPVSTRLMRDLDQRMVGGVCAGVARRYDWDPTLVRVVAIAATVVTSGFGILVYLAAWIIIPAGTDSEAAGTQPLKEEFRDAGERAAESARIIARAAKQAAAEVAEVIQRPSPAAPHEPAASAADTTAAAPSTPASSDAAPADTAGTTDSTPADEPAGEQDTPPASTSS